MRSPDEHRPLARPTPRPDDRDGLPVDADALAETIRERILQAGLWLCLIVTALGMAALGAQLGLDAASRGTIAAAATGVALLLVVLTMAWLARSVARSAEAALRVADAVVAGSTAEPAGRTGLCEFDALLGRLGAMRAAQDALAGQLSAALASPETRIGAALAAGLDGGAVAVRLTEADGRVVLEHRPDGWPPAFGPKRHADRKPGPESGAEAGEEVLPDGRRLRVERGRLPGGGALTLLFDVSAARAREDRLSERLSRLGAALDTMSQGFLLYDSAHRLLVANRRYHEIFRLAAGSVVVGMEATEVLRRNIEVGSHPSLSADEALAEIGGLIWSGSAAQIQRLADGRHVSVEMRPLSCGGFAAFYEDVTERWQAEARIAHMARHDALTDLPNRLLLRERIEGAITLARRDTGFAVLCLDLDNFKQVNDTLGHAVGDELLRAVAHRLRACLREVDTVARLGGDEFAVIQAGVESPADAGTLARRIRDVVSAPYALTHHSITVGVSIGIALAPSDGLEPDRLMQCADVALYRAKADGRGVHRFFESEMDARLQARRALELDLRAAVEMEAFDLHYQPIYDLAAERICGFEALLRWTHPTRGPVSPAEFVPLAEEIGLIVPLGEWVLARACREAASWPDDLKIAVNVSAAQFTSAGLIATVRGALAESGLPARRLELEITESVLLVNGNATVAILHGLRGLGARIAMDDFGTGYSSLSYLRSFPFDKMKIDRCFTRDLTVEEGSGFIVRAVISLASSLGMSTTAEGVETPEQLARLRDEGCDEVQGYLFSPPVPAAALPDLLETWNGSGRRAA
ncbi:diguanylate cyclase (GGDEF)-like protein [Methylorubrum rhodinum]|uniref:Diguanylate cyclase (GGDEF)-like protein n=1 Tax=Methylorubrum rhodinum TaxID=29428 RepID=A0A840ZEZ0_9HYPH|nr:EAL domain-containing protein [Methylorubrum rhodinum]MBB5755784.1 diguanylate cyclase (GGDEF)-like protein [Methylorubrum rhodinum]